MHSTTRATAVTLVAIAVVTGVACWAIGGTHAPETRADAPASASVAVR
ncbi:hypothetical protein DEJ13_00330 [Curtobacterium sp. MCLR17_007]|nr:MULTISPECIES: hypothetical protein [unclassified Curtobacterium]WIB60305.1 hypothetical protein DEJ13_00330 [Curtobacterium sp. MCLR17_007]